MFTSEQELQKLEKIKKMREEGKNPFPHNIKKDMDIASFRTLDPSEENKASVIGRLRLLRSAGKAFFANIEDESGVIQIYFNKDSLGEEDFEFFKRQLDLGDIIKAHGYPFVTKTGEFSLHANKLELVSKSICVLPEKFHGLKDMEARYRQRYLDLIMDKNVREDFKTRSKIISLIRRFFEDKGFMEVETPMMQEIAGGANAKPFITHHNALGVDKYLKIAPELFLKRLIIGGYEAVFEINRCFRNEGMDHTHNPEFTTIEWYWAYHNYHDLMLLTEELFAYLQDKLKLPDVIKYVDLDINIKAPFARVKYLDALVQIGGLEESIINDKDKIIAKLKADNFEANEKLDLGHLQAELFDNYVESKLINPTFIMDFPVSISPLSRRSDENPELAERFELFIAGKEIANAFNELNDPQDQYQRFLMQIEAREAGNDEACEMDEDYCRALGYAMAPTAGEGIGIDRLVMLLTNKESIKDVILFPAMRPARKHTQEKDEN